MAQKPKIMDPDDGLIVDEVGAWASGKHARLRKYIDAYRSDRAQYLPPKGTGGSGYIELFSGPGRSQIKGTKEFIDGSPLVAYNEAKRSGTRFSDLHFNDLDREQITGPQAAAYRTGRGRSFLQPIR
jgi:three-Cys-motif partner protein